MGLVGFGVGYEVNKLLAIIGLSTHPIITGLICAIGGIILANGYSHYVNHTTTELQDGNYQNYRIVINCRTTPNPQYTYQVGHKQEYLYSYEWEIAVRIDEGPRKWWVTVFYAQGPVYVNCGG